MPAKTKIDYDTTKIPNREKKGPKEIYIYFFYPNGIWDEEKYTLEEAQKAYPKDKFIWVKYKN